MAAIREQVDYIAAGHTAWTECPECGKEHHASLHERAIPLARRVFDCPCGVRFRVVTQVEQRNRAAALRGEG